MSEYSTECQAANRIAAQLRGRQPLKTEMRLNDRPARPIRAEVTGIPKKGGYLRAAAEVRQADILAYCHEFFAENDQLPTQLCVATRFDVTQQVAQKYMIRLCDAGHIERNSVGRWRFKRVAA